MGITIVRWLARHLECEPTREAVAAAREVALRADPVAYTKSLLDAAGVVAVLADEGYPQPPIPAPEFAGTIGVPVHRVARLEPWILARREGTFDDLVAGVEADATEAASDPNCVAYKSIVAYRTGLDVGDPSPSEAAEAFTRWRADGWGETRAHAKPVRDFLIRRTLAVAKAHDRAFHFHCGGGDPDIDLEHASPKGLFPLLVDVQHQPVVLVHSGFPWVEGGGRSSPRSCRNVYLELSELIPWGWGQVEPALDLIVGSVPAAKIMYGSDEAGEPEGFWVAALMARAALQRVLGRLVDRDDVAVDEAHRLGELDPRRQLPSPARPERLKAVPDAMGPRPSGGAPSLPSVREAAHAMDVSSAISWVAAPSLRNSTSVFPRRVLCEIR